MHVDPLDKSESKSSRALSPGRRGDEASMYA